MQHQVRSKQQSGLTLIELLVALSVLIIVVSLTAPSLQQLLLKQRLNNLNNRLLINLTQARSEAIRRGQYVFFCAAGQNQACAVDQKNWHNGWLLFVDLDLNRQYSPADILLAEEPSLKSPLILNWNRSRGVRFDPRGQTVGFNGSFNLCSSTPISLSRKIVLSNTGRSRSMVSNGSDRC